VNRTTHRTVIGILEVVLDLRFVAAAKSTQNPGLLTYSKIYGMEEEMCESFLVQPKH